MGKDATPRLGDFEGQGLAVEVACRCGHRRIVPPGFLLKLYGPEARLYPFVLERLAQRLRCSVCQKHDAVLTVGPFGRSA